MEEKKEVKVGVKSIIFTIVVVLVIIIGIVVFMITKNNINEPISTNTQKQNTIEIPDVTEEESSKDFDLKFLKLENEKSNMIYSPLSIKYALNMLNEGASGNTKKEIEEVIGDLSLTKYKNIEKVLSLANCIYIRERYASKVSDDFKNDLINKYDAQINYDEFENAENVNKWIEDKTLGIIKNMLKDELFTNHPNLEMLIINALAIDMEWENSFEAKDTYGREFTLANGEKMNATTMNKETSSDSISYYKDDKITALLMNLKKYDDTGLEFLAIMPEEDDLSKYIENVTKKDIEEISNKLIKASSTKAGLNIHIPKFSYEKDLKLKEDLEKLGIKEAFNDYLADFSKMTNTGESELFVGKALHKANIDFTEEGVKAAAVTVFAMMDKAMILEKEKPEEVKIDKPFMYIIRDKDTNEIWFVGSVYEPNSWEKDKSDYEFKF